MENSVKKRSVKKSVVWLVMLAVFATIVIAGSLALSHYNSLSIEKAERESQTRIYELNDGVNEIQRSLSKLIVCDGGEYSKELVLNVYKNCGTVICALNSVRDLGIDKQKAYAFFNDLGEWCRQKAIHGKINRDVVESSYATTRQIYSVVETVANDISRGEKTKTYRKKRSQKSKRKQVEIDFAEIRFFDLGGVTKRSVAHKNKISETAIKELISSLMPEMNFTSIKTVGQTTGEQKVYEIEANGRYNAYFSITDCGEIKNMEIIREIGKPMINEKTARAKAVLGAKKFGYNVEPVWYSAISNVAYVTLATVDRGVTVYPESVKVKVALDNGDVLGIESSAYCQNHTTREYDFNHSLADVLKAVGDKMQVESARPAVIKTDYGEALCFEISGSYKGVEYLAYFSANDLSVVKVLCVTDDDGYHKAV